MISNDFFIVIDSLFLLKIQLDYSSFFFLGGGGGGDEVLTQHALQSAHKKLALSVVTCLFDTKCTCIPLMVLHVWTRLLQSTDMLISSVESQKGINSVQWCSVENQKGTVQSLDGDGALLIFNITSLNNALLLLSRQFVHAARCVNGVYSAMPSQYCQKVTTW